MNRDAIPAGTPAAKPAAETTPVQPLSAVDDLTSKAARGTAAAFKAEHELPVALPGGQQIIAADHAALTALAKANGLKPEDVLGRVTQVVDGRVAALDLKGLDVQDLSPLSPLDALKELAPGEPWAPKVDGLLGALGPQTNLLNVLKGLDPQAFRVGAAPASDGLEGLEAFKGLPPAIKS